MINSYGNKLELDGYCPNLGIGFEHHGQQHYGVNIFRVKDFEMVLQKTRQNDLDKQRLCKQHYVKLLEIPALSILTKIENLPKVIASELSRLGIHFPQNDIVLSDIVYSITRKDLEKMNEIAALKNGKCLSNIYVNSKTHMLFECKNRHRWKAIPSNIKKGKWCPKCRGKR